MPMAIGTPTIIAMNAATTVPKNTAAMPNTGGSPCGFQVWVVKRLPVLSVKAGMAFQIRNPAIAAMTTSSSPPDPAASPLKILSPSRTERPVMPGLGPAVRRQRPGAVDPILVVRVSRTDGHRAGNAEGSDLEPVVRHRGSTVGVRICRVRIFRVRICRVGHVSSTGVWPAGGSPIVMLPIVTDRAGKAER